MAEDYSKVERRCDLPRVGFTVGPAGTLSALFYGRGIGGDDVEAKLEPASAEGAPAVLSLRIPLSRAKHVPWVVIERITSAELREGRWLDVAEGRSELPPVHESAEALGIGAAMD